MTGLRIPLVCMLLLSITGGCRAGQQRQQNPQNRGEGTDMIAEGNNRFGLEMYGRLRAEEGNLFFSPYSISTALAMTYAGARGSTEEQMAKTLHFPTTREQRGPAAYEERRQDGRDTPMTQEQLAQAFGRIIKDLNARGAGDKYELRVANALWGQRDYAFLPTFTSLVKQQYGGNLEPVDFVQAAENARQTINTWVEKQTNGKIKDLLAPGTLDAMTRLVLTNAIYFKGNWASQFKPDRTREQPFTLLDGTRIQTPMMNQTTDFGYAQIDTLQVLQMPYVGEELSMVILLPQKADGIRELEKALTAENLSQWLAQVHTREVIVSVPKFKMTSKFSLEAVLRSMGMTDAFTEQADFSGMTGARDLFISAVIHQAYVDVNEEGTEAAAATGVTMKMTSIGPDMTPVFRADHPFLFLIRDNKTGSILFLGRLTDPRAASNQ